VTDHPFVAGDIVFITGVSGTGAGTVYTTLNETSYSVGNTTENTFELVGVDTSAYQQYNAMSGTTYELYREFAIQVSDPKNITGITQTNPPVVTVVGHGYSNGDMVNIAGVVGMTQVNNAQYTIANVATDTFELSGIDATGYTAYVSGGKSTKGAMMRAINPLVMPGIGGCYYAPGLIFKTDILSTTRTVGSLTSPSSATIVIPVKIRNFFGGQEKGYRTGKLSLFVAAPGGSQAKSYGLFIYAGGSTSVTTLSAATDIVPAIGTGVTSATISNVRPHYFTQKNNEGNASQTNVDYFTFDITVTMSSTSGALGRISIEYEELQSAQ
jgi:hypothetical protein